jgi:hypothetical protein
VIHGGRTPVILLVCRAPRSHMNAGLASTCVS